MSVVEVTVKSQKGKCNFGHKVGDKIVFNGRSIEGEICYGALMVLLPRVYAMRYNAEFPWAKNNDVLSNACPDPENPVVFEIRRIKKQS
ncbi:MAG: TIGR04076 family protein [Candidatus Bathyarchaeia archaeon]